MRNYSLARKNLARGTTWETYARDLYKDVIGWLQPLAWNKSFHIHIKHISKNLARGTTWETYARVGAAHFSKESQEDVAKRPFTRDW